MLPTWLIEKMAQERRERERRERARLWIETPADEAPRDRPEPSPAGSVVIRIEIA
jgi:hypothetical protein